jgi:hypothetical protein
VTEYRGTKAMGHKRRGTQEKVGGRDREKGKQEREM